MTAAASANENPQKKPTKINAMRQEILQQLINQAEDNDSNDDCSDDEYFRN